MKRKTLLTAAAVAVVLSASAYFVFGVFLGARFVIALSEADIQTQLDRVFPIDKPYLTVLTLRLSNPAVELQEGADRVAFTLTATVNLSLPGQTRSLGGTGTVITGLRYEPSDASFYLNDPIVESLTIQGVPVAYVNVVNTLALEAIRERVNAHPVYTLRDQGLKQRAARLVLQGLEVRAGKLIVTLGS